MATRAEDGWNARADEPDSSGNDDHDDDDSVSGSSYIGSDAPDVEPVACRWRNDRFHDQECSRYFDCPSHIVERAASETGGGGGGGGVPVSEDAGGQSGERGDESVDILERASESRVNERETSDANTHRGGLQSLLAAQASTADFPATDPTGATQDAGVGLVLAGASAALAAYSEPRPDPPASSHGAVFSENAVSDGLSGSTGPEPPQASALRLPGLNETPGSEQITPVSMPEPRSRPSAPSRASGTDEPPLPSLPPEDPPLRLPPLATLGLPGLTGAPGGGQRAPVFMPEPRSGPGAPSMASGTDEPPLPSLPSTTRQIVQVRSMLDVSPPATAGPGRSRHGSEGSTVRREPPPTVVLPRWQPDAEVTLCPICHTQFSIFVRKHHCRKCGRVVCNSCSPHRITIPFQFIVQPPGSSYLPSGSYAASRLGNEVTFAEFQRIGGGQRVRLCNPCVPDPNTSPPQAQLSPGVQRSPHHRSQSSAVADYYSPGESPSGQAHGRRQSGYASLAPARDSSFAARSRSVTMQHEAAGSAGGRLAGSIYQSAQSRILTGTPPAYFSSQPSGTSSSRYPGMEARSSGRGATAAGSSSSSSAAYRNRRSLPPAPQPQYLIAEEDECPVCHRELPRRSLPNFEALRESHISSCIITHSTYSGTPSAVAPSTSAGASAEASSSTSTSAPRPALPPPRRTGMFPYLATEKDCVDSAECTICLEEFEVGVPMARLECLCRFHHACISAWFVGHPGRCPVHQHDSFGY